MMSAKTLEKYIKSDPSFKDGIQKLKDFLDIRLINYAGKKIAI